MEENKVIAAIGYVTKNNLEADANKLANEVGNIYVACMMIHRNIPHTPENIEHGKQIARRIRAAQAAALKAMMEPI